MSKHKWLTIISIVTMFLLITGCSDSKTTQEKISPNQGTVSKEDNPQATTKLESDTNLAQQIEAEKGIVIKKNILNEQSISLLSKKEKC